MFIGNGLLYPIEPIKPIQRFEYHCGSMFSLQQLQDMLKEDLIYGILIMDNASYTIAILSGVRIQLLADESVFMPRKHHQGGQSAQRFERVREEYEFYVHKKIAEEVRHLFVGYDLNGLIIGGAGQTKDTFVNEELLPSALQKKLIGVYDCGYTGYQGIKEVLQKASNELIQSSYVKHKKAWEDFWKLYHTSPEKVSYGYEDILRHIQAGRIKTLLLSEDIVNDRLIEECDKKGAEIIYFPTDTEEGCALLSVFRGMAGLMRY